MNLFHLLIFVSTYIKKRPKHNSDLKCRFLFLNLVYTKNRACARDAKLCKKWEKRARFLKARSFCPGTAH